MSMPLRHVRNALIGAASAAVLLAACVSCGSGSPGASGTPGAGTSNSSPAGGASSGVVEPSAAPTGTDAGHDAGSTDIAAACAGLVKVDAVPSPDGGPDAPATPEANKEFGTAVLPALQEAEAKGGHELGESLRPLIAVAKKAASEGAAIPDDDAVTGAMTGFHTWAHKNCGYQNVDITAIDYRYEGIPDTLKAGPTSIGLANHTEKGEFHIALVARAKDATLTTVDELLAVPLPELEGRLDTLGVAAAPPGGAGGLLLDLKPGRYFVACPVAIGGDDSSGDMHMMHGMVATFEVS